MSSMAPLRMGLIIPEVPTPPAMLPEVNLSSHLATVSGTAFSALAEGAGGGSGA